VTAEWVRTAHGDAWEELGRHRVATGGGTASLPGIRLMASGLPHAQWNNGDVDDPVRVDIEAVRDWYSARAVPWGVRVPSGTHWEHGRWLFRKRLMGVTAQAVCAAAVPAGVSLRPAGPDDPAAVLAVGTVAFEESGEVELPWIRPLLSQSSADVALAELDGEAVAAGYSVATSGRAGRAAYVAGIGVLPHVRRRGIATAISSWLTDRAVETGAELVHLHPDTDAAAAVYRRLGFVEVGGLDVYVDLA
jgi:ribosomal protein S18 acetylase RimI-like enzyme